jgi:hypothetical protein
MIAKTFTPFSWVKPFAIMKNMGVFMIRSWNSSSGAGVSYSEAGASGVVCAGGRRRTGALGNKVNAFQALAQIALGMD